MKLEEIRAVGHGVELLCEHAKETTGIDIKRLRADLAKLGYMLAGLELREEIPDGITTISRLSPTSPMEAWWALSLAIGAQGEESAARVEFEEVANERRSGVVATTPPSDDKNDL